MRRVSSAAALASLVLLIAAAPTVGATVLDERPHDAVDDGTNSRSVGPGSPLEASAPNASAERDTQSDLVTLTIAVQTNTGEALGGAEVVVTYDGGSNMTQTFSNGKTLVDVPRGADVRIDVTDDVYVINEPVEVSDVDSDEEVTVTMYPKATAIVEVNDANGAVRNARVTLRKRGASDAFTTGSTGPDGVYQISAIESGTYEVTVVKRGYSREQVELGVTPPSSVTTVTLEEATVTLDVRVFDDHFRSDQPLDDAVVTVITGGEEVLTGRTGDTGRRQLTVGANGRYVVRVTKEGYTTAERELFVTESDQSLEFGIRRTPELTVTTGADRVLVDESVLVQVKNAYDESVEGVLVRRDDTNVGRTDDSGEIRVPIPSTGTFEIVAVGENVTSDPVVVEGFRAATATPDPTPTPTPTPSPTPTQTTEQDPLPGFGAVVALVAAVLAVAFLVVHRRDR